MDGDSRAGVGESRGRMEEWRWRGGGDEGPSRAEETEGLADVCTKGQESFMRMRVASISTGTMSGTEKLGET